MQKLCRSGAGLVQQSRFRSGAEVQRCRGSAEVQKWCRAIVQKPKASFAEVQVQEARVHLSWMC